MSDENSNSTAAVDEPGDDNVEKEISTDRKISVAYCSSFDKDCGKQFKSRLNTPHHVG